MSAISRLRVPQENGAVVAVPPLDSLSSLVAENREKLSGYPLEVLGRPFQEIRNLAQASAIRAAKQYLHNADEPIPEVPSQSLVLSGHQPELFHPGVWMKNFALNRIARLENCTPVNLIVDNDICKSNSLSVPQVQVPLPPIQEDSPRIVAEAFAPEGPNQPYEERTVPDEGFFADFAERLSLAWGFLPMLADFWQDVIKQAERTPLLGERFSGARRAWERKWGCHNLELPVSHLCRTEAYAWFCCHLLGELPRFHQLYNETVIAYRQRHRIKSKSHPVPNLAAEGEWLEAPFWAWKIGDSFRKRLFVRASNGRFEIRVEDQQWPALPVEPQSFVASYEEMAGQGFKIRSRALTNTLFARMFLGDLFLHGLGGGKYDELTDRLIADFYGVVPAKYAVLSATLLLPFPKYPATAKDCRKAWRKLRDLRHNPQRHLSELELARNEKVRDLAERKKVLINQKCPTRKERKLKYHALKQVTRELAGYLTAAIEQAQEEWETCRKRVDGNRVLQSRDYSFVLYPEELIREFCQRFL